MLYRKYLKRGFDIVGATLLLFLFMPVLLMAGLISLFTQKGNIFFKQTRLGKNEEIFHLYKFTTMLDGNQLKGLTIIDPVKKSSMTITPWGGFLRNSSLDELLQLINVIKGDLSLVGPRPLLPEYADYFSPEENVRHSVRPGMTGLAQVNGRNALEWSKRLAMDVAYVEQHSLLLDLKILWLTFIQLFKPKKVALSESLIDYRTRMKSAA